MQYNESKSYIKEDIMSKETNKQKPNAKKKPQHTLKEKRQAKKDKVEGKPLQMMPSWTYNGQVGPRSHDLPDLFPLPIERSPTSSL